MALMKVWTSHGQRFVPSGRQLGTEIVELSGRELRETHLSEFGSHDRVGKLVVLAHSGDGVADRLAVVQPGVEKRSHRLRPRADLSGCNLGDELGQLTICQPHSGPKLALGGMHHLADLNRRAVRTAPRVDALSPDSGGDFGLGALQPEIAVNL